MPSSLFWTIAVSGIIVAPVFITSVWDTIRKPKDVVLTHHINNSVRNISDTIINTLFTLICLPYEAFSNLMAIARTLWRMLITRKKLLEWNASANEEITNQTSLPASYSSMWIEPFLTLSVFILLAIYFPEKLVIALPILLLWFIAPFITWWTSKPLAKKVSVLTNEQNIFLRKLARKTWGFFERFVEENDNWLPPDNFQEQPIVQIAHRTSPTNIGLSLLASLSARDFGYITTGQFIDRTTKTISTMKKMERYKGHFYNWYDTETLNPLLPKYISTVDNGNLVGHLLVLRQELLAIPHQKLFSPRLFEGLRDTLRVLTDTLEEKDMELLKQWKVDLDAVCNVYLMTCDEVKFFMDALTKSFTAIIEKLNNDPVSETYWWKQILNKQLEQVNEGLQIFTPWFLIKDAPPKFIDLVSMNANSTLIELLKTALELKDEVNHYRTAGNTPGENKWLELFQTSLTQSVRKANERITATEILHSNATNWRIWNGISFMINQATCLPLVTMCRTVILIQVFMICSHPKPGYALLFVLPRENYLKRAGLHWGVYSPTWMETLFFFPGVAPCSNTLCRC